MDDHSRPVTGYPASTTGFPPQPPSLSNTNHNNNGYSSAAAGTAYPYAAPPPQASYYPPQPNPYHTDSYAIQRANVLRRIFSILIACIIVTGTVIFIIWLVLRPHIPKFRVDSVTLTNFNLSTSLISGKWDVGFTARNPNKKITLSYDDIDAYLFYRSELLSKTTVSPFVEGTKSETTVRATFSAVSAYVDNRVADGIHGDMARRDVRFNVRILARVWFKAGAWPARRRLVRVYCGDLEVGLSSNSSGGSLIGGYRECRVVL